MLNSDMPKHLSTEQIDLLKLAIEKDLKLSLEEKAVVLDHLESGKYDMREAVHKFSQKMTAIMQEPSTYERGKQISEAICDLEKACGL